jgi:hypothetical protein
MAGKTKVIFDEWDTYVRETEDGPIFISFDVQAGREDLTDTLTHCARVSFPIHEPGESGGPQSPENERLWQLEDELCAALSRNGVACRQVGRITYQGQRVLVFQADNLGTFEPVFRKWASGCTDYDVKLSPAEGWDFFDECVRPDAEDWLFMADSSVIRNLMQAGSNPEKEHALDFVLQGDPGKLAEVADILEARGYERSRRFDPSSGEIVMVKRMPLDLRTVLSASLDLYHMAGEKGIKYDGWGAAVVR